LITGIHLQQFLVYVAEHLPNYIIECTEINLNAVAYHYIKESDTIKRRGLSEFHVLGFNFSFLRFTQLSIQGKQTAL
jgi:hypothetical protein